MSDMTITHCLATKPLAASSYGAASTSHLSKAMSFLAFRVLNWTTPDRIACAANPGKIGVKWVSMEGLSCVSGKWEHVSVITKERFIECRDALRFDSTTRFVYHYDWIKPEQLPEQLAYNLPWEIVYPDGMEPTHSRGQL
jgi:hypothetical protein